MSKFLEFLNSGIDRGGFGVDDALAAILPLMRQVLETHEAGKVAPLKGVDALQLTPEGHLAFDPLMVVEPQRNVSRVEAVQASLSSAVDVVGQSRHVSDVDEGSYQITNLDVSDGAAEITRPMFLVGYKSWEHAVDHHDELTDIFSLGMLLASMACGLDFTDRGDVELFAHSRGNLFVLNARLHPVIASLIGQMTELNRHRRAQDLEELIRQLANYREQPVTDFDTAFLRVEGFKESPLAGKRRIIQSHLRDRLFEISRRNRLIYFKPTLQALNLTVASVPLMLDYRNIRLEQLFVWHAQLAEIIVQGAPMSLSKYLRFEDAPYIPGVLDKIISEARRDRAEYGFAQLRLVLCFLRWNNLKEAPEERIHSPLLLLPVELTKKKGVRDHYVLDPTSTEAEVNPALRHHLKSLYNLDLPEAIDLRETTLQQFHEVLQRQIRASEPGVTLNLLERPQIELIHQRARIRLDQYRRRLKLKGRSAGAERPRDYSYSRGNFRPLGLQLFVEKVRPRPLPLSDVAGAPPAPRRTHIIDPNPPGGRGKVLETERQMFALREGESQMNQNPYAWDFDLCSLTLGNFNYRKMTLVRDYNNLINGDQASVPFDTIFSLSPRQTEEELPGPLPAADQHLIIPCDATQASAIAKVRGGRSYIIQGPPGTGKSQTITNLIADYVARGKRVLFVCEKRAAIDIVYHRLRQQGLDELCCLIHDSQTDKKAFILNLKQTYEKFLSQAELDPDAENARAKTLRAMEQDLDSLRRFSEVMRHTHTNTGVTVRSLLHRLVELRGRARELPPAIEDLLPEYPLWLQHGDVLDRLRAALAELGADLCFARHPLRWLGKGVLQADRPIETLSNLLDQAEDLLDAIESALELSGLPGELWDTFEEIQAILEFAARARPLAERNLLGVLATGPVAIAFDRLAADLDAKAQALARAQQKTAAWRLSLIHI